MDAIELLARAKRLFHKSQIQIFLEAISEYIDHHYEGGATALSSSVTNAVAVSWSAGVFEASGVVHQGPSHDMQIAVEVSHSDRQILDRLRDFWGGSVFTKRIEAKGDQLWVWSLKSERAEHFLDSTLPYMKGTMNQVVRIHFAQAKSTREATDGTE